MLLTDLLGRPVVDAQGRRVGRLLDVTVYVDRGHPLVHRAMVGSRRSRRLVPWAAVHDVDADELRLGETGDTAGAAGGPGEPALEEHELLLGRDVLDTEVVDLAGERLSRVSDVLLVDLGGDRREVAAVDVGLGGLLRRLGLRRLGDRLPTVAVDWADLHLTSSRGHVVELSTSTAGVHRLDSRGLAELLARLSLGKAADVMRTVGPERSAGALHRSHPAVGRRLLHALGPHDAQRIVQAASGAASEHLTELHGQLPARRRRRFLRTAGWRVHRPTGPPEGESPAEPTGQS